MQASSVKLCATPAMEVMREVMREVTPNWHGCCRLVKSYARIMRAGVFIMREVMREVMRGVFFTFESLV